MLGEALLANSITIYRNEYFISLCICLISCFTSIGNWTTMNIEEQLIGKEKTESRMIEDDQWFSKICYIIIWKKKKISSNHTDFNWWNGYLTINANRDLAFYSKFSQIDESMIYRLHYPSSLIVLYGRGL